MQANCTNLFSTVQEAEWTRRRKEVYATAGNRNTVRWYPAWSLVIIPTNLPRSVCVKP